MRSYSLANEVEDPYCALSFSTVIHIIAVVGVALVDDVQNSPSKQGLPPCHVYHQDKTPSHVGRTTQDVSTATSDGVKTDAHTGTHSPP